VTILVQLFCLLTLAGIGWVAAVEFVACHRRGRDRVHRGTSWQPRTRRLRRAVSPDPCRVCAAPGGWHDQDCAVLDRLLAGQVSA
jgi:hypothetical protein